MTRALPDARRRVLPMSDWPQADRAAWKAAIGAAVRPSFTQRSAAAELAQASLKKAREGYGRWLGFLDLRGLLGPDERPADRVTQERAAAYLDELRDLGNADHTIVGRFTELEMALRLSAPAADFRWLRRPGGVPLRRMLPMRRRSVAVHHSRVLYGWGLEIMTQALAQPGPDRRRVAMRDGLMIAILAPSASAAILGITGRIHQLHYDRGRRAAAASHFHQGLAAERRDTEGLAKRLFASRATDDASQSREDT